VLGRSKWWFGEVSNKFELGRDRYGGDLMHGEILGLRLAPYAPNNSMHRWIRWVWFGEINDIANLEDFI
jgi:hypothetical protein